MRLNVLFAAIQKLPTSLKISVMYLNYWFTFLLKAFILWKMRERKG